MILTADIGASKVRIATYLKENGSLTLKHIERYLTCDHAGFLPILKLFLASHPCQSIKAVSIGAAGIVEQGTIKLTNLNWILAIDQIEEIINTKNIFLLNDVEAHGYGLSTLKSEDVITLQQGRPRPGNKAFIAVGTGLGESILFCSENEHIPCASEGGHADFAPRSVEEEQLLGFLRRRYNDHVSWERVVSGKFGFRNLFDFLIEVGQIQADDPLVKKLKNKSEIGKELQEASNAGHAIATKIMHWFVSLFGAEAGNLALKAMAVEGVYLSGGIVRRNTELLTSTDNFILSFNAKGRMAPLLRDIPVYLVLDQNLAMRGLANYALKIMNNRN